MKMHGQNMQNLQNFQKIYISSENHLKKINEAQGPHHPHEQQ